MRTCKVILVILFVLMTALTCFSHFYRQESVDDTPPVLTCFRERVPGGAASGHHRLG